MIRRKKMRVMLFWGLSFILGQDVCITFCGGSRKDRNMNTIVCTSIKK